MCQEGDENQFNHNDLSHLTVRIQRFSAVLTKPSPSLATWIERSSSNYNSRFDEQDGILANEEFGATNCG